MPPKPQPQQPASNTVQTSQPNIPYAGNNPYGAKGILKCNECRRRRRKCDYPEDQPELPCEYCEDRPELAAVCVKLPAPQQLAAQGGNTAGGQGSQGEQQYTEQTQY